MIVRRNEAMRRDELLYYFALTVFLATLFIDQTELRATMEPTMKMALRLIRYASVCLMAVKLIIAGSYPRTYLLLAATGALIALACALSSGRKILVYTAIAAAGAYRMDRDKVFTVATFTFLAGTLITVFLSQTGVFHDYILEGARGRHTLGFNWVTLSSIYWMFITVGYCNIRKDKITFIEIAAMGLGAIYLYKMTDARMSAGINFVFLLGVLAQKYLFHNGWKVIKAFNNMACILPFALFAAVIIIQLLYKPGDTLWDELNQLLSTRLSLGARSMELPITLFGQKVEWHGNSLGEGILTGNNALYNYVDCSYLRIMIDYGIAGIATTLAIYAYGIFKAVREKNGLLIWSYILVLCFCLTEPWMTEFSFNPFLLIAISGCVSLPEREREAHRIRFHPGRAGLMPETMKN